MTGPELDRLEDRGKGRHVSTVVAANGTPALVQGPPELVVAMLVARLPCTADEQPVASPARPAPTEVPCPRCGGPSFVSRDTWRCSACGWHDG